MAGLSGKEVVYDLYGGTGSIGIYLSKEAHRFIGVEYVQDAVDDAWKNAELNGITHGSFFAGDMKEVLNDEFIGQHGKPDVLITDPPRTGMHVDVVNKILEIEAPKVVYVSCNPATLARDLELLAQKYEVVELQPVDLFPHTHHVENVALLILKK
jgi:23S rRNA (uracil1939-C5)-methyltransferase